MHKITPIQVRNDILILSYRHYHYHPLTPAAMSGQSLQCCYTVRKYTVWMQHMVESDRLDLRLPTTAKQLLQQAAAITGNTLSALVLNAALDRARDILQTHQHFVLTTEEWRDFMRSLDDPPPPTAALRQAWRNED
ncbi:DUF1778 domain-containing protein [Chromatium okenii]|nr:DUF1778 domain-containing protein [Chromatium okenii]